MKLKNIRQSKKIPSPAEIKQIYKETMDQRSPILVYYFYRKISFPISSRLLIHTSVTPNQVTLLGLLLAVLAFILTIIGRYPHLGFAALFIQLVLISDCMDGEIARLKNMTTKFGEWLDNNTDLGKMILLYFGLAIGYYYQSRNVDAFILLSLLLASRSMLSITVIGTQRIFGQQIYKIVKVPSVSKIERILGIKPQFLTFSDDIKYLILSLGVLLNQLKFTMLLFIFIYLSLWLFAVIKIVKTKL